MKFFGRIVTVALALCMVMGGVISANAAKYEARIGHLESPLQPRHQGLEKVASSLKSAPTAKLNSNFPFFSAWQPAPDERRRTVRNH